MNSDIDECIPLWYWCMSLWLYPCHGELFVRAKERRERNERNRSIALRGMIAAVMGGL